MQKKTVTRVSRNLTAIEGHMHTHFMVCWYSSDDLQEAAGCAL